MPAVLILHCIDDASLYHTTVIVFAFLLRNSSSSYKNVWATNCRLAAVHLYLKIWPKINFVKLCNLTYTGHRRAIKHHITFNLKSLLKLSTYKSTFKSYTLIVEITSFYCKWCKHTPPGLFFLCTSLQEVKVNWATTPTSQKKDTSSKYSCSLVGIHTLSLIHWKSLDSSVQKF